MQKYFNSAVNLVKNAWVYSSYLKPLSRRLGHSNYQSNAANTIALFSTPRSGSTWFASLLNSIPKSAIIDEPLWQGPYRSDVPIVQGAHSKLSQVKELGFHYQQNISIEEKWPEAQEFFEDLFDLKIVHPDMFSETNLNKLAHADNFIFKFNYANLMMPWLIKNFSLNSILLLRHPCAVIASQLDHPAFQRIQNCQEFVVPETRSMGLYKQYSKQLSKATSPEGILATMWALSFINTAADDQNDQSWITTTYEQLILNPQLELARIFNRLNIDLPAFSPGLIKNESMSTKTGALLSGREQLGKWQEKLTQSQVTNIMNVLDDFEIDAYTSDLEPDYTQLTSS